MTESIDPEYHQRVVSTLAMQIAQQAVTIAELKAALEAQPPPVVES